MTEKLNLSVGIITFNEEKRIENTLKSIKDIASEIIIIDSYSEDNTVNIAKSYGAKVFLEEWKGFIKQKNSLINKCSSNWILFLDADEEITKDLAKNIKKAIEEDIFQGFYIKRKTFYLGKLLNYSWQPDLRLRLIKANANPKWSGEIVHEELNINGKTDILKGFLIHYSYKNIEDHFTKTIKYAKLSAKSYIAKGRKPSIIKLIFNPFIAFFKLYFIKGSILDGMQGFIAAMSAFIYAFLKYIFLWEIYYKDKLK